MTDEIKEIVQKASPSQSEMVKAVKYYIKDKKNIDVDINVEKNINPHLKISIQNSMELTHQLQLLHAAFEVVANYYCAQIFPHQNRQL